MFCNITVGRNTRSGMRHCNVFWPLMALEHLLILVEGRRWVLASLYTILLTSIPLVARAKRRWEQELGVRFFDPHWYKIKCFILCFSRNVSIQETRYFLINR